MPLATKRFEPYVKYQNCPKLWIIKCLTDIQIMIFSLIFNYYFKGCEFVFLHFSEIVKADISQR